MNIEELISKLNRNVISDKLVRGKILANRGKVKSSSIRESTDYTDDNSIYIESEVESENSNDVYDVEFVIDVERAKIVDTVCSCPDYDEHVYWRENYMCKHITATYHVVLEKLKKTLESLNTPEYLERRGEELLDDVESLYVPKEKVKLDIYLYKKEVYNLEYFEVEFKLGTKKMYVLKNLRDFTINRLKGISIKYGKEFIYNPNTCYFDEKDERILDFIEDYILTKGLLTDESYGFDLTSSKQLKLPVSSLRRFLEIASHKKINFLDSKMPVLKGDFPLEFEIAKEDECYSLELQGDEVIPLSIKRDVFVHQEKIYLPSKKQINSYKMLSSKTNDKKKLLFKKESATRLFNDLIPMLKNISDKIEYDESLGEIKSKDLEAAFYFDENRKKITLDIKFKYGEDAVNLLEDKTEDKIIIRDKEKEQEILKTVDVLNISKQDKAFVFSGDEEALFDLLKEGYKKLEEYGDVYYSESFKNRRVYSTPSINASISEGSDGYLDFTFNIEEINPKEYKDILASFRNKKRYHKLKDNSFINLEDEKLKELLNMMDAIVANEKIIDNIKLHKNKSVLLNEFVNRKNLSFIKGKEVVKNTVQKLENINEVSCELPQELDATLREYQITGFKWFNNLNYLGFGGILADEMGLGKTLQAISFILSQKDKKTLIVAPTSLVYNWRNEFKKFAPTLKIAIVHGNKDERNEVIKNYKDYDVLLTTYGTLRNDEENYKDITFDFCIIDEAQNIKNALAQSTRVVKDVKAKIKFALTGTPIENNLLELWSIFDFVMPGYLYTNSEFKNKFIDKEEGIVELQKYIKPFILRRLKKEVISELPEKIEKKHYIELTKEQKKVYKTFVNDIKEKMEDPNFEGDKITIFSYLTKLRQLCLEPSLIIENYKGGNGKLEASLEIIKEAIEGNHKILLFSQFTSVLAVICEKLKRNNIEFSYLDGSTKAKKRLELVEEFNNDENKKVFLISLKAGGTGLNLTSADVVIHFDPWWNPAIEEQATDRAHRIGQKNVVEVIKLIAEGTIEERIVNLQEEKKELISNVMNGGYEGGNILSSLSNEELMELFM